MPNPRKLHIKTYGCQMNVYDSERMADLLKPMGYEVTSQPDQADLVILNTCHIREKAAEKVYSDIGRLRNIRQRGNGDMKIAVAGCVAQAEGAEIIARAPAVDIVVGPQSYHRLPELLARQERERGSVLDTEFPAESKFDEIAVARQVTGPTAFVTVQEGCDKFCTFCVVPYTRGAEASRPAAAILQEIRELADQGVREVTLLGQNVNAYHGEAPGGGQAGEWGLGRLIREIADIPNIARIRYTTSHPKDMDDDLIAAHGQVPALMPYLHLPIQSGSNKILDAMNRGHDVDSYRRIIDQIRALRPDLALSSDFIVGFPGESDEDFDETMKVVKEIGYVQAFSFKYSRRPGTPGSVMPMQVPDSVKASRLQILQDELQQQTTTFAEALVGHAMDVLVEKPGRHEGQLVGRSPYLQPVFFDGQADEIGKMVPVDIIGVQSHSLAARRSGVDH